LSALGTPFWLLHDAVVKMGHRKRVELIEQILKTGVDPILSEENTANVLTAILEIYDHRNDYLHDLHLPDNEPWLTVESQRQIEHWTELFASHFTPGCKLLTARIATPNRALRNLIAAAAMHFIFRSAAKKSETIVDCR
jgi:hypothetical protein